VHAEPSPWLHEISLPKTVGHCRKIPFLFQKVRQILRGEKGFK
jgi:hypothetical protein